MQKRGWASLLVQSTLGLFAVLGIWLLYFHFFSYRTPPASSVWNWNDSIHVPCHISWSFIETNGIKLSVLEAGPMDGKLLLFQHGFPETAFLSWQHQICFFAELGYHVVAPDLRGYNTSDKPQGISNYHLEEISKDVIGLLDYFKVEKAVIVGHDWGAVLAWWIAASYPERVEKLAILNAPHSAAYREHLKQSFNQFSKSWYIFYFQLPYLPEDKFMRNNFTFGLLALAGSSKPGHTFTHDAIPRYLQAWSEPNAVQGMINWYRALIQDRRASSTSILTAPVNVDTLIIWGKADIALDWEMAALSAKMCKKAVQVVYFDDATHWVQHDKPQEVNAQLLQFIQGDSSSEDKL
jgi:pimeloyl-ACP methyl ester carboxylesterase